MDLHEIRILLRSMCPRGRRPSRKARGHRSNHGAGQVRGHLEALQHRFPDQFGNSKIVEFAGTDYAYRVFLDKALWSEVLVGLSEDLDYDNFKSEVARFQGRDDAGYEHALHDVWSIMYELQRSD